MTKIRPYAICNHFLTIHIKLNLYNKLIAMQKNTGNTDRVIRLVVAVGLSVLNISGVVKYPITVVLWAVAAIMFLTAVAGTCPLYKLFGINTSPRKQNK